MIDPVGGGYATEGEIRAHLALLRKRWMQYHDLDKITGGQWRLAEDIAQLERALSGGVMKLPDAEHVFLKHNNNVKWNTGNPTWEHWQLVEGEWLITTYQIHVELTPIQTRSDPADDL